jgi:hypothetical protein
MHVPWSWIKQRPHFIAEGLSEYFDITLVAEKENDKLGAIKNTKIERINFVDIFSFNNSKSSLVSKCNYWIKFFVLSYLCFGKKIIWITYPFQWHYIRKTVQKNHIVVYDCMDDILEIYEDESIKFFLFDLEKDLCKKATNLVVSSDHLKKVLESRYSISRNILVVNNAIKHIQKIKYLEKSEKLSISNKCDNQFNIVYIGTISKWFDFKSIIYCLDNDKNLKLMLYGPVDTDIPSHSQIVYAGLLEHDYVFQAMELSDLLVMPFILTDLVLSVNPVKAYEYIYSGKPVALVKYCETEKFSDYVNLYSEKEQLFSIIQNIKNGHTYVQKSREDCLLFCSLNTWEQRCLSIYNEISLTIEQE